jgi:hypothetical protein
MRRTISDVIHSYIQISSGLGLANSILSHAEIMKVAKMLVMVAS